MSDLIWLSEEQMRGIDPGVPLPHRSPKVNARQPDGQRFDAQCGRQACFLATAKRNSGDGS